MLSLLQWADRGTRGQRVLSSGLFGPDRVVIAPDVADADAELSVRSIVSADSELPKPPEEDSTSGIHGFVRLPVPVLLMR